MLQPPGTECCWSEILQEQEHSGLLWVSSVPPKAATEGGGCLNAAARQKRQCGCSGAEQLHRRGCASTSARAQRGHGKRNPNHHQLSFVTCSFHQKRAFVFGGCGLVSKRGTIALSLQLCFVLKIAQAGSIQATSVSSQQQHGSAGALLS